MKIKKIFICLLIILLSACSQKIEDEQVVKKEIEYIKPVNQQEIFEYLNQETKDLLYRANGNVDLKTTTLQYMGKELLSYQLTDYYGRVVDLDDLKDKRVIIEIAASWCTHCMAQSKQYSEEIIKKYPDIVFIQYFNDGDDEGIKKFYDQMNMEVPKDIYVVGEDDTFSTLLLNNYNPEYYPGFLFFNNGKLTWVKIAELTVEQLGLCYDVCFNDGLDLNDLCDENGKSIFEYTRSSDDVKNDLSLENYELLKSIDNDDYSETMTLKYLGREFDISDQLSDDSAFESELDFVDLLDKSLVIIYLYKIDEINIQMINDYYDGHPELEVIVVNVADENCTEMANLLVPPMVSIMNQIPKILNEISFINYPSAVFVENNIICGIYSNIENIATFNQATDIFLGINSIARIDNN